MSRRQREKIEADFTVGSRYVANLLGEVVANQKLLLEVLLDIREEVKK